MNNSGYTYNDYLKQNDHFASDHRTDIPPAGLDSLPTKQSRRLNFSKTPMIILLVCVILIPVILGLLFFLPPLTVESAIWKWEKYLCGHEALTESMAPVEYWDYLAEKNDITRRAAISDARYSSAARFSSTYHDHFDLSLEILSQERVALEECQGLLAFLQNCGIRSSRVNDCQQLIVQASYEGTTTQTYTKTAYAVQIDLFWYIVVHDSNNGGYCFLAGPRNPTGY